MKCDSVKCDKEAVVSIMWTDKKHVKCIECAQKMISVGIAMGYDIAHTVKKLEGSDERNPSE